MKKTNLLLLLLVFIFFPLLKADAFSLNYNQPTGKVSEIKIGIDKESTSLEAIEGVIVFDPEAYKFLDVSTDDSMIADWTVYPYLADQGKIAFSGIFDSNSQSDNLFNVFFTKNSLDDLKLSIEAGVVLAENDMLYNLEEMVSFNNSLFNVISSSHPNSDIWYSNKNVELSWTLPEDAQKVKILIDQNEEAYPSVEYDNLTQKQIALNDGVWYFHIRYFGDNGWSSIENKKIMIDTQAPTEFKIIEKDDRLEFTSTDELSQVEKYEVIVSDKNYIVTDNMFLFSEIGGGKYFIKVKAYDRAGNFTEKDINLEVERIEPPHFSAAVLGTNEIFILGYVDNSVDKVYVSISGDNYDFGELIQISDDGNFVYTTEKLKPGLYDLYFTTISENGLSEESKKVILITEKELVFGSVERTLITYGLIVLLLVLMYACSKKQIKKSRKRNKKVKK
ncbi:MAG: hypothetical protein PHX52_00370 [Candidatus Pacebacteria bacterium]|nr:hypothetical protein [Candidatus Paceibacterota bacterium]